MRKRRVEGFEKEDARHLREYAHKLKQPWVISVLFVAFIPFFPEYFAPIFAAGALMAAGSEIRNTGTGFQVGTIGKIMLVYIAYMAFGLLYSPNFCRPWLRSACGLPCLWSILQ